MEASRKARLEGLNIGTYGHPFHCDCAVLSSCTSPVTVCLPEQMQLVSSVAEYCTCFERLIGNGHNSYTKHMASRAICIRSVTVGRSF